VHFFGYPLPKVIFDPQLTAWTDGVSRSPLLETSSFRRHGGDHRACGEEIAQPTLEAVRQDGPDKAASQSVYASGRHDLT
jgi:hypothetical protein